MTSKIVTLLIVLLCLSFNAHGMNFRHLTVDDGLPQMSVYAIEKDSFGYMWLGTGDGLSRFDGYDFVTLPYAPNTAGLPSNTITALKMASNDILWVGSAKGISRINTLDFTFLPAVELEPENVRQISHHQESTWVVQHSGISEFKGEQRHSFISIDGQDILTMAIVEQGIWIGTNKELHFYSFAEKTLTAVEAINESVDVIYIHSADELLLATQSGLVKLNTETQHIQRFSLGNGYDFDNRGDIQFITKHPSGHIWIGSWNQGVYEFNKQLDIINVLKFDKNQTASLSNNEPKAIYFDNDLIWIGNQGGGLNLLWERSRNLSHVTRNRDNSGLSHPLVRSIGEINDVLLVGTSDGLNRLTESEYENIAVEPVTINGDCTKTNRAVSAIKTTQNNRVFVTTTGAGRCFLFEYDAQKNTLNVVAHIKELPTFGVNQIMELDNEDKLLLTITGVYQFSDTTFNLHPAFDALYGQVVWVGMQDKAGRLWLGTHTKGIYLFSQAYELLAHFENDPAELKSVSSNYVKSFLQDSKGRIWIGTAAGLNLFDEQSQSFNAITQKDGLSNNTIYGILEDAEGYLWLSTNSGINRFNPQDFSVWQLNRADGLQSSEFNTGAFFKQNNGNLVFGGINGINILKPINLAPRLNQNKIRVGQLELNSDEYQLGSSTYLNDVESIELDHHNIRTQISLSNLDFINQQETLYAYQLLGLSDSWFELPQGENFLSFSTLAAGDYQLKLKSRNGDDVWSVPQSSLRISVLPAPWFSLWAYIAYLTTLVVSLLAFYYWRINILRQRQFKLEELVLERTETVNQQAQVLVLQNDILQKTITEKDHVFAHVTHEFKTPMTLVLNPLRTVMSSATAAQLPMLELIERNSHRLNHLVDQLVGFSELQHTTVIQPKTISKLNDQVALYLSDFANLLKAKNIRVAVLKNDVANIALPVSILDLVLSNLFSNAIKYCSENGIIQITISTDTIEHCHFSISNTHENLPEEQLKKMFERFYRVPMHQTRIHGTGLGLALVKDTLALYDGNIIAKNLAGSITLELKLPLADGQEAEVSEATEKRNSYSQLTLPTQHLEIKSKVENYNDLPLLLIIEDDPDMRLLLHSELRPYFELLIFSQPQEGIHAAIEQLPDVILLDYMLPELNGDAVTAILRNNALSCHIPILILTAKSDKQTRLLTLRALVDDFMAKPFDSEELIIRLFSMIEIRQLLSKKHQGLFDKQTVENSENDIEQQFRLQLTDILAQHYSDCDFDILKLASLLNVSERQLQRKCKSSLDTSPKSFIRDYRLIQAKQKLLKGEQITRVGFDCGFSSSAYFTQCFRAYFGYPPSEAKNNI